MTALEEILRTSFGPERGMTEEAISSILAKARTDYEDAVATPLEATPSAPGLFPLPQATENDLISLLAAEFLLVIWAKGRFDENAFPVPSPSPADYSNTKAVGEWLYTNYLLAF